MSPHGIDGYKLDCRRRLSKKLLKDGLLCLCCEPRYFFTINDSSCLLLIVTSSVDINIERYIERLLPVIIITRARSQGCISTLKILTKMATTISTTI